MFVTTARGFIFFFFVYLFISDETKDALEPAVLRLLQVASQRTRQQTDASGVLASI